MPIKKITKKIYFNDSISTSTETYFNIDGKVKKRIDHHIHPNGKIELGETVTLFTYSENNKWQKIIEVKNSISEFGDELINITKTVKEFDKQSRIKEITISKELNNILRYKRIDVYVYLIDAYIIDVYIFKPPEPNYVENKNNGYQKEDISESQIVNYMKNKKYIGNPSDFLILHNSNHYYLDNKGNIIKVVVKGNNKSIMTNEFTIDIYNNVIKSITNDGEKITTRKYLKDKTGVASQESYFVDYTAAGLSLLKFERSIGHDESFKNDRYREIHFKHDNYGNILKSVTNYSDDSKEIIDINYEYDDKGNWIIKNETQKNYHINYWRKFTLKEKILNILSKREIEYFQNNYETISGEWWNNISDNWKKILELNIILQNESLYPSFSDFVYKESIYEHYARIFEKEYNYESNYSIKSLLQRLNSLKKLNLYKTNITELFSISLLKNIEGIDLTKTNIEDLSSLKYITNLKYLEVTIKNKESLISLPELNNLETLIFAERSTVPNLDFVSKFKNLRYLDFKLVQASEGSALVNLKYLECLTPSLNFTKLDCISKLNSLIELDIGGNKQINDFSTLNSLINLERLNVRDTNLSDLTLIEDLNKLKELNINGTEIEDFRPIEKLINIEHLYLSNTYVSDINFTSKLKHLKSIDLSHTGITDFSPLLCLENLELITLRSKFLLYNDNIYLNELRKKGVNVDNRFIPF